MKHRQEHTSIQVALLNGVQRIGVLSSETDGFMRPDNLESEALLASDEASPR